MQKQRPPHYISIPWWSILFTYYIMHAKSPFRIRLLIRHQTSSFFVRYKPHLRIFIFSQDLLGKYLVILCFFVRNVKSWNNFILFIVTLGWYIIFICYQTRASEARLVKCDVTLNKTKSSKTFSTNYVLILRM